MHTIQHPASNMHRPCLEQQWTGAVPAYLAYAPPQVSIACGHDVALVAGDALADAVIRICALVRARDTLEAGILQACAPNGACKLACGVGGWEYSVCKQASRHEGMQAGMSLRTA